MCDYILSLSPLTDCLKVLLATHTYTIYKCPIIKINFLSQALIFSELTDDTRLKWLTVIEHYSKRKATYW